jgi:hypothetical protein
MFRRWVMVVTSWLVHGYREFFRAMLLVSWTF